MPESEKRERPTEVQTLDRSVAPQEGYSVLSHHCRIDAKRLRMSWNWQIMLTNNKKSFFRYVQKKTSNALVTAARWQNANG